MKKRNLTFGTKLGISTGLLGAFLALLAGVSIHSLSTMDEILRRTIDVNARKVKLSGQLNAAESDMAVGQRGVILFTYAKNASGIAAGEAIFQDASARFRKALAEIRPMLVTDR